MSADDAEIQDRVETFVCTQLGVKRTKVSLNTRLLHDLGMDGDDAAEFFDKFATTFNVDLSELGSHWDEHFGPEGGVPSLGAMIVIWAAVMAGFGIKSYFGTLAGLLAGAVIIGTAIWIHNRWFAEESRLSPVTVSDLIDSARAGRWLKFYQPALFRSLSL